jgi:RNA polymerase sigma-70 factor (ECF subfamily)
LIASLDYYLADEYARKTAVKRGGGQTTISIDSLEAEKKYALEPIERLTPRDLFERRWALTLLEQVLGQLQLECQRAGKQELFSATKHLLRGERGSDTYSSIASELGMTEGALKMSVSRMRLQFRERLLETISHTVGTPGDLEPELRHLLSSVAS